MRLPEFIAKWKHSTLDPNCRNDYCLPTRDGLKSIAHCTNPLRGSPLASGLARPSSW